MRCPKSRALATLGVSAAVALVTVGLGRPVPTASAATAKRAATAATTAPLKTSTATTISAATTPTAYGAALPIPRFLYDSDKAHLETVVQAPQLPAVPEEGWVRVWADVSSHRAIVALTAPIGSYDVATSVQAITVHKAKADIVVDPAVPFRGITSDQPGFGVHWVEGGEDVWAAAYGTWTSVPTAVSIAERSKLVDGRLAIEREPGMDRVVDGPPSQVSSLAWAASWATENLDSPSDDKLVVRVLRYDSALLDSVTAMWTTTDIGPNKVRLGRLSGGSSGDVEALWRTGPSHLVTVVTHAPSDDAALQSVAAVVGVDEATWYEAAGPHLSGVDEIPPETVTATLRRLRTGTVAGTAWSIDAVGDRCYQFSDASAPVSTVCRSAKSPVAAGLFKPSASGAVPLVGVAPRNASAIEVRTPSGDVVGHAVLDGSTAGAGPVDQADATGSSVLAQPSAAAGAPDAIRIFALTAPSSDRALTVVATDARGAELGRTTVAPQSVWLHSDPGFTWPTSSAVAGRTLASGSLDGHRWTLDAPISRNRLTADGVCLLARYGSRSFALPCAPSAAAQDDLRSAWVVPLRRRFIVVYVGPRVASIDVVHTDGHRSGVATRRGELGVGPIGRVAIVAVPTGDAIAAIKVAGTAIDLRVPGDRWATAWWSDPRVGLAQPGG